MENKILEQFLPNQKYYEFNTRGTCQVLVTEKVMRKISKIIYKADAEIKNLLHNADEGNVIKYDWTLSNVKDENNNILKQQAIVYEDFRGWVNLKNRINGITLGVPKYENNFYVIKNEQDLKIVQDLVRLELEEQLKKDVKAMELNGD